MIKRIALAFTVMCCSFSLNAGEIVDINKADAVTIAAEINGIGKAKAMAIVKYRDEYGPFQKVDDLIKVAGIGEKTLVKIRPYIIVSVDKSDSR